jgi:cytochrome c oxidase cbb3-type subunit I/II
LVREKTNQLTILAQLLLYWRCYPNCSYYNGKSNIPTIASVAIYAIRIRRGDLYIREGCVGCHSQMVRPFRSEVERYGPQSKAGEFVYDHPFLWGSKRTGPDLLRVGGKYNDNWHFNHM